MNDEVLSFVKKEISNLLKNNFLGIRYHKLKTPVVELPYLGCVIEEPGGPGGDSVGYISMKLKNKVIQALDLQISSSMNRSQVQAFSDNNIDLYGTMLEVLVNEFKTSFEKLIIDVIDKNSEALIKEFVETVEIPLSSLKNFINKALIWARFLINGKRLFKPDTKDITRKVPFSFESGRAIVSKIFVASNMIASKSRRGPGNFIICNVAIGSILQNEPNFVNEPLTTLLSAGASIYKMGTINNIKVFVNPMMSWNSNFFYVGRNENNEGNEGNPDAIGLNVGLLEESICLSTIAEATMAPKLALSARLFVEEISDLPGRYFKVMYDPDNTMMI